MADDPAQILQTSTDAPELAVTAIHLAQSEDPADHKLLGDSLQSSRFLDRLDTDEEYRGSRRHLRLAEVMRKLAANDAPSARKVLVSLTRSGVFLQAPSRVELLIDASASIRPAPPEVVGFWQKYSDPDGAYMNLIVAAVLDNGTAPALEFFEKVMADPAYPDRKKIEWMRVKLLPHRYEVTALRSCDRMLRKELPEHLRPNLVEALFDYRPTWHRPTTRVKCPELTELGPTGRAQLRQIADYALKNVPLTGEQKRAVENTLERLEAKAPHPPGAGK